MPARRSTTSILRQLLAAGSATLLLLLAVLAVSPESHRWLHSDSDQESHGCAVVLFACGVSLAAAAVCVAAPAVVWQERPAVTIKEIFLASPRYLRQPERGPPDC